MEKLKNQPNKTKHTKKTPKKNPNKKPKTPNPNKQHPPKTKNNPQNNQPTEDYVCNIFWAESAAAQQRSQQYSSGSCLCKFPKQKKILHVNTGFVRKGTHKKTHWQWTTIYNSGFNLKRNATAQRFKNLRLLLSSRDIMEMSKQKSPKLPQHVAIYQLLIKTYLN